MHVTPQLLETATHTLWHDEGYTYSSRPKTMTAPDLFGHWGIPGQEFVRFGKILGITGGAYSLMPVLPELYDSAVRVVEGDYTRDTHLDRITARMDVVDLWNRFFKGEIAAMGGVAINCLRNANVKPIQDPNRGARCLLYIASVVHPNRHAAVMGPSRYDSFDALVYSGFADEGDNAYRTELARNLRNAALDIRSGQTAELDPTDLIHALDELMVVPTGCSLLEQRGA